MAPIQRQVSLYITPKNKHVYSYKSETAQSSGKCWWLWAITLLQDECTQILSSATPTSHHPIINVLAISPKQKTTTSSFLFFSFLSCGLIGCNYSSTKQMSRSVLPWRPQRWVQQCESFRRGSFLWIIIALLLSLPFAQSPKGYGRQAPAIGYC